jgi:Na+/phosphate symporter
MKNLIYQKKETDKEVIITFKYLWVIYLIFIGGLYLFFIGGYKTPGVILAVVGFALLIPVRNIASKAMKEGCQIKGSKWSIRNPLEIQIKKSE